ncbi:MAG: hypothetical protein IKL33_03090 [Alphaproteobacteria bacterium]|nr:hypothetical protein [Alphaproteobacteria bacterium]
MMDNIFLTEIIATRLSHDLIGNIGAVSNAVELLKEGDENDLDDVNNILEFSSLVLAKRLKFFRLCFGMSNASVKDLDELKKIVNEYLETIGNPNYKIVYKQDISTPKIYKFVMPSVMMMADILIKGGEIVVKQTDNSLKIEVSSSEKLNISKLNDIQKILNKQEVNENISSFAPLYYLLTYTNKARANVFLNGSTLVIGE